MGEKTEHDEVLGILKISPEKSVLEEMIFEHKPD